MSATIETQFHVKFILCLHLQIHVIGYEKRGNKYHPSMVDIVLDICGFLKEEHVRKIFLTKSNFPKVCTVSEVSY